ncbi:MAG: hypothetical protein E7184_03695 [Erysipelotrichaceae bacterium]|nr:hypothetical protein [Erysipelotrichaceae bacterium]
MKNECKCGICGEIEHNGKTTNKVVAGDLFFCEVCGTVEKSVPLGERLTDSNGIEYTHKGVPVKSVREAIEAIVVEYKEVITEKHLIELQKCFELEGTRVVVNGALKLNNILNELHELSKSKEMKKA